MSRHSSDQRSHLPPWLQDVPLPPRPASRPAPADEPPAGAPLTSFAETDTPDVPDWLRDTPDSVQVDPWAPSPMRPPTEPGRIRKPAGATDWLRSMGIDEEQPAQRDTPPADSADAPPVEGLDWLQRDVSPADLSRDIEEVTGFDPFSFDPSATDKPSTAELDTAQSSGDSLPGWLLADAEPPDSTSQGEGDMMPNWLTGADDASPVPPAAPPASGDESIPAWLAGADDAPPAAPPAGGDESIPAWLAGADDASPAPPAAPPASGDESIPAWLAGADDASPAPPAAPPASGDESIPAWLAGADDPSPAPPAAPPASGDESIPAWLAGADDAPPAPPAAPPAGGDESIPAWLAGADDASPAPPAAPPAGGDESIPAWLAGADDASPAPPAPPASGDESIPAWLAGADDAPPAPPASGDESMPAWLAGADDASPAPPAAPAGGDESIPAWLAGADDASPAPPAAPPAGGDESMPAWLAGADDAPPAPPAAPPAGGDESMPAWLAGADDASPAPPAAPPAGGDESMPAWLAGADDAPPAPPAAPPAGGDESIPAWLAGADDASPAPPAPPAGGDESIPAWLAGADDAPPAPPAAPAGGDESMPAWLTGANDASPEQVSADSETATLPPMRSDAPPWLQDAQQPHDSRKTTDPLEEHPEDIPSWLRAEVDAPPANQPAPDSSAGEAAIPDWLQGTETTTPTEPPAPPDTQDTPNPVAIPAWLEDDKPTFDESPLPTVESSGLPAWLQGADRDPSPAAQPRDTGNFGGLFDDIDPPAAPPRASQEAPPPDEASGFLGTADLPSWLRPSEQKPSEPSSESRAVSWLSNLSSAVDDDSDSVVVAEAAPAPVLPRATYQRSPEQVQAISLLQQLTSEPYPEAAPTPEPAPRSLWQRIGVDRVLYGLLVVALLVAALLPAQLNGLGLFAPSPDEAHVLALADAIADLDDDDTVLLAYEWDAQRMSELRPLESALTQHLIDREVKMISVSTDPLGTILSFDLRDTLLAAGYRDSGIDYVLLGYKPGGDLALRQFAQDFSTVLQRTFNGDDATQGGLVSGIDTGRPIDSLNDLGLIVVMADQPQDVQGWMEQVYRTVSPLAQPPEQQVPMVFLLPSEVTPIVRPYLSEAGVYYLSGKRDAIAYAEEQGMGVVPWMTATETDVQLSFGVLVFLVLLLLGGALGMLSQTTDQQRS